MRLNGHKLKLDFLVHVLKTDSKRKERSNLWKNFSCTSLGWESLIVSY